jgi:hypothetical protein
MSPRRSLSPAVMPARRRVPLEDRGDRDRVRRTRAIQGPLRAELGSALRWWFHTLGERGLAVFLRARRGLRRALSRAGSEPSRGHPLVRSRLRARAGWSASWTPLPERTLPSSSARIAGDPEYSRPGPWERIASASGGPLRWIRWNGERARYKSRSCMHSLHGAVSPVPVGRDTHIRGIGGSLSAPQTVERRRSSS